MVLSKYPSDGYNSSISFIAHALTEEFARVSRKVTSGNFQISKINKMAAETKILAAQSAALSAQNQQRGFKNQFSPMLKSPNK